MLPYWLLVAHLVGDYVLQSHAMATRKTSSWRWALIHAHFYCLPFYVLLAVYGASWGAGGWAMLVVGGTHALIDRYRLAGYWCRWWGVGFPGVWAKPEDIDAPPPFLGVWLVILVDNTMHLIINGLAAAWALQSQP